MSFDAHNHTWDAARYGLGVGDVNDVIESAIGGKTITTTVEGRERYPVSVRYARDFKVSKGRDGGINVRVGRALIGDLCHARDGRP